jgi:putative DNA methylase
MGTKLIEVALPLDAINAASAREKSIRHGHPSTLHLWWARRPLAAARAVLFASLVDDPSSPDYRWQDGQDRARSEDEVDAERKRLHDLIERLVQWENSNNETVLNAARAEIMRATDNNPPPVLDPFAGGGSIPLEAQRLGLEAHASDLNPVAVLINKALIEIPPKFAGQPPVNPADRKRGMGTRWKGAAGLAADVRYYGQWMRDEAERRIGHLYPKVQLPKEQGGGEAIVIAWLWARTVKCPNPACGATMPLVSSFWLSKKAGRGAWLEAIPASDGKKADFVVHEGHGDPQDDTVNRRGARCIICGSSVPFTHVRNEGRAGRMSQQLMAIVAEGNRGRSYLPPNEAHLETAESARPEWVPETPLPKNPRDFKTPNYGLTTFGDLFTPRQLVALTTFSDLVGEARDRVRADAAAAGMPDDGIGIAAGGTGASAYANAIATYLAFGIDKMTDTNSSLCSWQIDPPRLRATFSRQALPMVWDFAEANPFGGAAGDYALATKALCEVLENLPEGLVGKAEQDDATMLVNALTCGIVSTDPPYYDNIGYADLSDYFYAWMRRTLFGIYPELLRTVLVPKVAELVATPYRFEGGKKEAEEFFEHGLERSFDEIRQRTHHAYPVTIYYAFKQSETDEGDGDAQRASTGWETMLEGVIQSRLCITGTWPMRTEMASRTIGRGTNSLASSIVLACRPRPADAPTTSRNAFLRELRRELPRKLRTMQQASIAPVDLAQAAIGPGMAIYSAYSQVSEPNGDRLKVRAALQLINQVLDEVLTEQDSEHDRETGWAVAWFEQFGMNEAEYGRAETLATARAVSVDGLRDAGLIRAGRGRVQLIKRADLVLPPELGGRGGSRDKRLTDWEIAQYLIRALDTGRAEAAALKLRIGSRAEIAKDLAYRLYTICERKGWAQEALAYNALVVEWPAITNEAKALAGERIEQQRF